jgi:diguanylate cyclase (GGDEF)-like protein
VGSIESPRASDEPVGESLADARLAEVYDTETGATLRMAMLVIGVAAVTYLPRDLTRTGSGAHLLTAMSTVNAVVALTAWWWTRRHPVPPRFAHPVFAGFIAMASASTVMFQTVLKDPMLTTQVVIVLMTTGTVLVSWRWAAVSAATTIAMWLLFAAPVLGSDQVTTAITSLAFGAAAGAVVNVGRRRNIDRLFRANEQAEKAAVIDALTQVYNRRGLALVASHLVRTARRTGEPVGVLIVDVDRFKAVNDKLGHQVGDRVLVTVADALRAAGRESDVVARWGGDEFVVITLGTAPEAEELAGRVEQDLLARGITGGDGHPLRISVGAANVAAVDDPDALEALISEADAAMYAGRAQRRGGNVPVIALTSYQNLSTGW